MVTMSQPPISAEALALGLPGRMGRSVQYPTATGLCEECPWHNGHHHVGRSAQAQRPPLRSLGCAFIPRPSPETRVQPVSVSRVRGTQRDPYTAASPRPGPAERDLTTVHRALNPGQARLVPGPQLQERPSKSGRL